MLDLALSLGCRVDLEQRCLELARLRDSLSSRSAAHETELSNERTEAVARAAELEQRVAELTAKNKVGNERQQHRSTGAVASFCLNFHRG